jgi:flagellin-like hook-associated protein FlgL
MSISTKLFNENTIRSITGLNDRVNGLQEQVSTGKVDLRPSQDMAAAAKRSASSEMLLRVERYQSNVTAARNRLDLADSVMG